MEEVSFEQAMGLIRARDARYQDGAYAFVREALDYTQKTVGKTNRGRLRHVTGQELLQGIRDYALAQYGPMATLVLEEWGIHNCQDFGEIVFNMVETGVLAKTETDSRADFAGGYDFYEVFRKPFLPKAKKTLAEARTDPASGN
jgi:uncharacterized repeat protein (TIGR04138 family)